MTIRHAGIDGGESISGLSGLVHGQRPLECRAGNRRDRVGDAGLRRCRCRVSPSLHVLAHDAEDDAEHEIAVPPQRVRKERRLRREAVGEEHPETARGDQRLELGLEAKDQLLLALTLLLSVITLGTGRTTVLQGIVHLVIFAVFMFFAVVP